MRRFQTPPALINSRNSRFIEVNAIPQLARHRSMRLVQGLTVIRVSTTAHFITAAEFHFYKPIRIGERLACHADDVRVAVAQDLFSLFEGREPASRDYRSVEAR